MTNGAGGPTSDVTAIQQVKNTLSKAIADLSHVRVVTAIADAPIAVIKDKNSTERTPLVVDPKEIKQAFVTEINMIDGDTFEVVPSDYEDHGELADLHAENVERAKEIVRDNIDAVVNAAKAVIDVLKSSPTSG